MKVKNAIQPAASVNARRVRVGDRATIRAKGGRRGAFYLTGSIGADLPKRNYVKYLVERYHDYREADIRFGRTERLRYAAIFKSIEAKFKAPTYFIPENRFEELVDYLYSRINNTILGRRNNGRGIRNFESFDEYKMRNMASPEQFYWMRQQRSIWGIIGVNIRYHIDADTGLPHCYRHNITEEEVEQVLRDPIENRRGDGGSRVLIGKTARGRFLRVVVAFDEDRRGVFIITAYDIGAKPLKALRRRMRKRGQP